MTTQKTTVSPFLWFAKDAEAAARFYAETFPDSRVQRIVTMPSDSPSGPAGSVIVVEMTIVGVPFSLMQAGPHHEFNDAISFTVNVHSQAELDRYWDAILKAGGKPQACGWIIDPWGVRWQITPATLLDMYTSPDRAAAKRAADEMMKQVKLDIAALEAAFRGA